jgi:hypothetical protein
VTFGLEVVYKTLSNVHEFNENRLSKSRVTHISTRTFHISQPICVKFGRKAFHITLLGIYGCHETAQGRPYSCCGCS